MFSFFGGLTVIHLAFQEHTSQSMIQLESGSSTCLALSWALLIQRVITHASPEEGLEDDIFAVLLAKKKKCTTSRMKGQKNEATMKANFFYI